MNKKRRWPQALKDANVLIGKAAEELRSDKGHAWKEGLLIEATHKLDMALMDAEETNDEPSK